MASSPQRHGSVTRASPSTGAVRTVPGRSGQGTPCSSQPAGLGPTGFWSKVQSTGAGGAGSLHTVPQLPVTVSVSASP